MFKTLKFNKKLKNVQIMVSNFTLSKNGEKIDNKKTLYIGNGTSKILLKKFNGDFQYTRFICEAVIMRLCADKKSVSKVRGIYNSLVETLEDDKVDEFTL